MTAIHSAIRVHNKSNTHTVSQLAKHANCQRRNLFYPCTKLTADAVT